MAIHRADCAWRLDAAVIKGVGLIRGGHEMKGRPVQIDDSTPYHYPTVQRKMLG